MREVWRALDRVRVRSVRTQALTKDFSYANEAMKYVEVAEWTKINVSAAASDTRASTEALSLQMTLKNFVSMEPVTEGIRSLEVERAEELAKKIKDGAERVDTVISDGMRFVAAVGPAGKPSFSSQSTRYDEGGVRGDETESRRRERRCLRRSAERCHFRGEPSSARAQVTRSGRLLRRQQG